ncbi:hypothetical protein JSCD6_19990 [Clostridioides difficile]|nr:hypothetical protein HMPREF0219_1511 [Clostridioides difficile NAP07]GMK80034.1 hypothetical protein JSCD6_19990 [Clostridioides difficile]GML00961.1 hypothetical protein JSCD12_16820 [Clostridioides difficile]
MECDKRQKSLYKIVFYKKYKIQLVDKWNHLYARCKSKYRNAKSDYMLCNKMYNDLEYKYKNLYKLYGLPVKSKQPINLKK